MFSMSLGSRTTRGLAAAALILSLTATTYAGSANAAPLANTQACKVASQARNDAMSALRDAWKASTSDLKLLAKSTPALGKELVSTWRDLRTVLMQAVQDLGKLGLGGACQHENEDGAPTMGAVTTTTDIDAQAKAIVDQAIKDLKAVVDAARKTVADQTAATEPKDSTASDEPEDSTASNEPKDSTDGANGDEDKDSHEGDQSQDEDANANNEDKNEDNDNDHSNTTSKTKSTNVAKATSAKKSTNLAKVKVNSNGNHSGHGHERN